jgi:hypothetical protein
MAIVQRGSVLEAADQAADDNFGRSCALSADGTVLAVGAYSWETTGTNRGGVYLYDRDGSGWTQRGSVLEASDAADSDNYGTSVALSADGTVLAVGAYVWEGATGANRGGVYIYDRNGSGWTQRGSVLEAADAADIDRFGSSVALSADGTVLAVGAYLWEGAAGADRGGVYIYDINGSGWTQRGSVLQASDAADSDWFGISVALSADGTVLAVGAFGWETAGTNRGGVYLYDSNGSGWTQRGSVLGASDAADNDNFGISVALSADGTVLAVGAYVWEGAAGTDRGGVYLYDQNGSGWTQRGSVLEASDAANNDGYGVCLSLDDACGLAVGAFQWEDTATLNTGGVYIYNISGAVLTGSSSGIGAATGDLTTGIQLAGAAAGVATAAGTLVDLAGAATGVATATGDLTIEKPLEGAAAGQATAAGSLDTQINLAGAAAGVATADGTLGDSTIALAGAASGVATATGDLTIEKPLEGAAAGQATAAGSLDTQINLAGAAAAVATTTGTLDTQINLAGAATGEATATGEINFYRPLFGDAAAVAAAAGTLTSPAPPAKTFILGGVSVPFESHLDLNQDYQEQQASRITRHCDGSARKQTAWSGKTVIRTSGNGWYPPGFDLLDYDTSMEMSCIALRAITSASNTITIPASRRTDQGFEPFASATVNGGKRDATITGIVGNVVTVAAVSGAAFYTVYYYPKLTVFASLPVIRHDAINDQYSWQMEAREV